MGTREGFPLGRSRGLPGHFQGRGRCHSGGFEPPALLADRGLAGTDKVGRLLGGGLLDRQRPKHEKGPELRTAVGNRGTLAKDWPVVMTWGRVDADLAAATW